MTKENIGIKIGKTIGWLVFVLIVLIMFLYNQSSLLSLIISSDFKSWINTNLPHMSNAERQAQKKRKSEGGGNNVISREEFNKYAPQKGGAGPENSSNSKGCPEAAGYSDVFFDCYNDTTNSAWATILTSFKKYLYTDNKTIPETNDMSSQVMDWAKFVLLLPILNLLLPIIQLAIVPYAYITSSIINFNPLFAILGIIALIIGAILFTILISGGGAYFGFGVLFLLLPIIWLSFPFMNGYSGLQLLILRYITNASSGTPGVIPGLSIFRIFGKYGLRYKYFWTLCVMLLLFGLTNDIWTKNTSKDIKTGFYITFGVMLALWVLAGMGIGITSLVQ